MYRFYQILCFILKNDHNFKSCWNMIFILTFNLFYHKPQCFSYVIHIITHLHLTNDYWNLNILKLYFEFLKFSSTTIMSDFCVWMVGYHHLAFFPHQNFLLKKFLSRVLYKFDFLVLKLKSLLLKLKLNLLDFFNSSNFI